MSDNKPSIKVWVLPINTHPRKLESRVGKILSSNVQTLYVEDPWFIRDFGISVKSLLKSLWRCEYGIPEDLNDLPFDNIISNHKKGETIGFVLDPSWKRSIDYFNTLIGTTVVRLV